MPLYSYNGQLFQVGGELAASEDCCCNNCPGNSCCFMGECIDLPQEYCDMLNEAVMPGCASEFTACTACTEGSCECDDTTSVKCCIDGHCVEGDGENIDNFTECTCKLAGGCVVTDCEDCLPNPEPCDPFSETPVSGVMCMPDGSCIEVTTEGEKCLYSMGGGVFIDGATCEEDPCPPVPSTGECDPGWTSCCCLVNTITYLRIYNPGSVANYIPPDVCPEACIWDNTVAFTSGWTVESEYDCNLDPGSVDVYYYTEPRDCGTYFFHSITIVRKTKVDCDNPGLCSKSNISYSLTQAVNGFPICLESEVVYQVTSPAGCP